MDTAGSRQEQEGSPRKRAGEKEAASEIGRFPVSPAANRPAKISRGKIILQCLLLYFLVVGVFLPALKDNFVNYDDPVYVTSNLQIQKGLTWQGFKSAFHDTYDSGNWHPVTWLSHMLDCQVFGLAPKGHHLTSVLLHAGNTVVLFLVLRMMTGAAWRSLLVAALFGLHPLRVESVAWVAERKDVLSTLFWMLTLLAYARYVKESKAQSPKSRMFFGLSLLMFALGLMSKPMLVTVPFVLLLLDYWPFCRFEHQKAGALVLEKVPFLVLAAASSWITFSVQARDGATRGMEVWPLANRAQNALLAYGGYIGKLFWPVDLAVFYPHPDQLPLGKVILAASGLAGVSCLVIAARRRHPYLLTGWFWYLGTLVPVIGLVQVGQQAMADRYAYIPSVGLLLILVWGLSDLAHRWRRLQPFGVAVGIGSVLLCICLTRVQISWWKDSETLFRQALAVTRDNFVAHANLGQALIQKGRLNEAISEFQAALRLRPDDERDLAATHSNLGAALNAVDRLDEAIGEFREAARLNPNDAAIHNNLGVALDEKGLVDEAGRQFQEALRLQPQNPFAHRNLGDVLAEEGSWEAAVAEYHEALRLDPNFFQAGYQLGLAQLRLGHREAAIACFTRVLRLQPDYLPAKQQLSTLMVPPPP